MARIRPEHLAPFAKLVDEGLREGAITVEQAKDFSDDVFTAALEQQVRDGRARREVKPDEARPHRRGG